MGCSPSVTIRKQKEEPTEGPIDVKQRLRPPTRLDGPLLVLDLLPSLPPAISDPFVLWQELPRQAYATGDMPGEPMHAHRGLIDCPYIKDIVGDSPDLDHMICKDHAGIEHQMKSGDFEYAISGQGMEHEFAVDSRWAGSLHMFKLWINLPGANKMDSPHIVNACSNRIPTIEVSPSPRKILVKVLLGEDVFGKTSPVEAAPTPVQYLDIEMQPTGVLEHKLGEEFKTRIIYVYRGTCTIGQSSATRGDVVLLTYGDELRIEAGMSGAGMLLLCGHRINEPVIRQNGFVMSTKEEILKANADFDNNTLCGDLTREVLLEKGGKKSFNQTDMAERD